MAMAAVIMVILVNNVVMALMMSRNESNFWSSCFLQGPRCGYISGALYLAIVGTGT